MSATPGEPLRRETIPVMCVWGVARKERLDVRTYTMRGAVFRMISVRKAKRPLAPANRSRPVAPLSFERTAQRLGQHRLAGRIGVERRERGAVEAEPGAVGLVVRV